MAVHTLTRMASRRTTLNPLLRLLAAATLLCWLGALVLCSTECLTPDSDCQPIHHDQQAASSHHDHGQAPDSDKHDCPDNSFCDSLKAVVHPPGNGFIFKQDFSLAYILGSAPLSQALTVSRPATPVFRQAWRRDWVFTPEVYLGPAFRSQAPPVLL